MKERIKVLVVDDSVSVQNVLREILASDQEIEVIATVSDPYEAVAEIARVVPDVITLDIEMPRMDGLTFLKKLMAQHPIPVVVISSVVGNGSENALKALTLGAREIIIKPKLAKIQEIDESTIRITDAVKAAAQSNVNRLHSLSSSGMKFSLTKKLALKHTNSGSNKISDHLILIGASTGGTEVISKILKGLRTDLPGILVVQHMPGEFTPAFASRLNKECNLNVKEAQDGDIIMKGYVYIANGFNHLKIDVSEDRFICKLEKGDLVNRHRPSVDVLFESASKLPGHSVTAALLTGMGADGAKGLLKLHQAGARTFAQDEKSSVIFGMPREAIKLNAAQMVGNPDELVSWINSLF